MGELFGPRSVVDWRQALLTGGAEPETDGDLGLAPTNRFPNQYFQEIDLDGNPSGIEVVLPNSPVAYNVYESNPGNRSGVGVPTEETFAPRRETMTLQNAAPIPLYRAWTANQPKVVGTSPRWTIDDPRTEPTLEALPTPDVEVVAINSGYIGGTYGIAYELWTDEGRTTRSGATFFTLATGEGIRFFIPEGVTARATHIGILLTRVGGAESTLRRQGKYLLREITNGFVDLPGPYIDDGAKPATKNESGIGSPKEPKTGGKRVRHRAYVRESKARGKFKRQPGIYRFAFQIFKNGGLSLVSAPTKAITVNDEDDRRFEFMPPRDLEADEDWLPWVFIQPLTGGIGAWYYAYIPFSTKGGQFSFGRTKSVDIYGYLEEKFPKGLKVALATAELPEEDGTAIEAPDPAEGPDTPRPVGLSSDRGQPSTVLLGIAPVDAQGGEGPISQITSVSLLAAQTYKIRPQPTVGVLRNAEFSERGSDGRPADWTFTNVTAANSPASEGALTLKQATSISTNLPFAVSKPYPINADLTMIFVGAAVVTRRTTGSARLVIEQLDDAGVVQATTTLLNTTGGYSTLGRDGFRMGPGGTAWNTLATQVRYRVELSIGADASGNLDAYFENLQMFPFNTPVRKWEKLPGTTDNFSPSPAVPHPTGSDFGVGAPAVPTGGTPAQTTPLSVVDFASGVWPAGWVTTTNNGGVIAIESAAAMFGTNGVRAQNDTQGTRARASVIYDAGAGHSSLAIRMPLRQVRAVTRGNQALHRIFDDDNNAVAQIMVNYKKQYSLQVLNASGKVVNSPPAFLTGANGEEFDMELIVDGAGTANGSVRVGISTFGSPREFVTEVSGVNLTSRLLRYAGGLASTESDATAKWTYHFDQIVVTEGGDILDREMPVAATGAAAEDPDRPWVAATPLLSPSADGSNTITPSRTAASMSVRVVKGSTVAADREVLRFNPAANILADFHVMTGDTYRFRVRSAAGVLTTIATGSLSVTDDFRVELEVDSANSATAVIHAYLWRTGQRRRRLASFTSDQTGVSITTAAFGGTVAHPELTLSERVIWPDTSRTFRELDENGDPINQLYIFVLPGKRGLYGLSTTEPINVNPGQVYTVAVQTRHTCILENLDEPADSCYPGRIVLKGEGKTPLDVGSPFDSTGGLIGEVDWSGTDHFISFTVPALEDADDPGYTTAEVDPGDTGSGVYVFQEGLFAKGNLTTQALRDAARGWARETNGSFRVTIDTQMDYMELTPSFARRWASGGAIQGSLELPAGNFLENITVRSGPTNAGPWSPEVANFDLVPSNRCFQVYGELVSDGTEAGAPTIGPKGAFLELWPSVAIVLDENRESPPGFAIIGDTPPDYTRADYDVRLVGGRPFAAEITDDIDRLPAFRFAVFNETAARWALELTPNDELYIPAPYARGNGRLFRVRFANVLEVPEWLWIMPKVLDGERRIEAVFEVPWAIIEESSPLTPPRIV